MKFDQKSLLTVFAGSIAMVLVAAILYIPFSHKRDELGQNIKAATADLQRSQMLLEHQEEIEETYRKIQTGSEIESVGEWIRDLTHIAKKNGIVLDRILPQKTDPKESADTFEVVIRFRADPEKFSSVLHELATHDALSLIENVLVVNRGNGALDCEFHLSKAVLR